MFSLFVLDLKLRLLTLTRLSEENRSANAVVNYSPDSSTTKSEQDKFTQGLEQGWRFVRPGAR